MFVKDKMLEWLKRSGWAHRFNIGWVGGAKLDQESPTEKKNTKQMQPTGIPTYSCTIQIYMYTFTIDIAVLVCCQKNARGSRHVS